MKRWKRFLLLGLVFVLLTGCTANHSESYRRALDIFASGEYEEAAQAFEKLGDYQQSAQYAAYSRGLVLWLSLIHIYSSFPSDSGTAAAAGCPRLLPAELPQPDVRRDSAPCLLYTSRCV